MIDPATTAVKELLTKHHLHDSVWGKRILKACKEGFTYDDISKANSWVTCACGEATGVPRQNDKGSPLDHRLRGLGLRFAIDVEEQEPMKAAEVLIEIEKRAIEVANRSS